ncbi:MAG: UDP-3-O-(3-hydroxymyristoyl)glucosamine N-acyltransferase [Deltaproteobacteria bacterium]|nr:MAG: UDP-3-O-(3-hydroxymyristoyl)glucosamine N-acyltransferase [Deltaproteobacteria bacterium]
MKTLKEIAEHCQGLLVGDGDLIITGIAGLDEATEGRISFVAQRKYLTKMETTRASALIVPMEVTGARVPIIRTENPYLAYARIAALFSSRPFEARGISKEAWIGKDCRINPNVSIYPFVYIGDNVQVESGVTIYPGVYIGNEVSIGEGSAVYPNVTIMDRCIIGARIIIHSGVVIGSDGFGYARDGAKHVKIPQLGIVQIDDDVEIGANTTIDRAALGKTWIKRGTKIDNLVQVAHNVIVGEDTLLISQVGISGSVEIGNNVILAGQVGVAGHIKIGDRVKVGAKSGVPGSLPEDSTVSGIPAISHQEWLKASAVYRRLPDLLKEVRDLKKRIANLEKNTGGHEK